MELQKWNEQSVKREEFPLFCSFLLSETETANDNILLGR